MGEPMTTAAHAAAAKTAHAATCALQKTTAKLTTVLPLFEAANGRIAELLSRMDDREQHMTAIEDGLRRTMEAIVELLGDPNEIPDELPEQEP